MSLPERKTILVDIDGTICEQRKGDYENAKPYEEAIRTINRLYEEDYRIVVYTSRFMGRHNGDVEAAYREGYDFTLRQLKGWGLKFHELKMGKPSADIIIDDKAVFFKRNWEKIYEECKKNF